MMVHLRRYLIAGLLVWVPLVVTLFIIRFVVALLDFTLLLLPPGWRPETLLGFNIPGLGFVVAVVIVLLTGLLAANIAGRKLVDFGESVVHRIPLVRSIYSAVKQVLQTLLSNGGQSFRRVLMVEYPRKGIWTIGFQTGVGVGEVQQRTAHPVITVFIPTTPNPTSGFIIMVPQEDVIALDMSVEEGLKFVMSLGVVVPVPQTGPVAGAQPVQAPGP
ncbi:MAG: DUF502 domain-containing protein [Pseudomonadales bacterium]